MSELLAEGRAAYERHDWHTAFEKLTDADRAGELGGADLSQLAMAAWFAGQPEATIDALERAYAARLREGDRAGAAMAAFRVAEQQGMRMAFPLVAGWLAKAQELAAEVPDAPVHGRIAWMHGLIAWVQGDLDAALEHYERAIAVAEGSGDRGLRGMALHDKGHALAVTGRVAEGLSLMDEAMASAVAGEMEPFDAGYVYCGMISACTRLGDYVRASEWTEATSRWCDRESITGFPGVCRVHRAELLRLRGSWPQAEQEARLACEELPRFNLYHGLGPANYEIGEVRRRMGDHAGAHEAYARAHEYGYDPQPGLSLLLMAQGKLDAAVAGIRGAVSGLDEDSVLRARPLAAQAEIALAAGDIDAARRASEELDAILAAHETVALRAMAACVRGAVLLATGEVERALPELRSARADWQAVEAPYETAEVRLLLGRAHDAIGDGETATMELKAARSTFERLGAMVEAEIAGRYLAEASSSEPPERVTRGFMFTDIVKSTDLASAMGDEAWESLLSWHDQTLRALFASHGGEVAHHTGDGFFVAFERPKAALECAIAIQRALVEHRRAHGFAPRVRIGVHAAEATRRGADFGGAEVHKAARIAALAGGEEILTSVVTMQGLDGAIATSEPRAVSLKGFAEPVEVVSVVWR